MFFIISYPVIRLRFANAAAFRPVILLAVRGGSQLLKLCCPEPAIDFIRKKIGSVAALEVAETARCPNVFNLEQIRTES